MPNATGKRRCRRAATLLAMCVAMPAGIARAAVAGPTSSPSAAVNPSEAPLVMQIAGLRYRFQKAQQEAYQAYAASQDKLPKPHAYVQKAMELARQNPKDPAAVDALRFVVELTGRGMGSSQDAGLGLEAIEQLSRDQLDNPSLASVFPAFMYGPSDAGTKLMRLAAEKSTNRDVRGSTTYWLAQSLRNASGEAGNTEQLAEAKRLYQKVADEYADVKFSNQPLGEEAKSNLFEMENLAIGKVAPEIEGKNQDGKPMKLSDYRGKVVALDFWGDW